MCASSVYYAAYHNFRLLSDSKPYGPDNPFSYVHTSPDMLDLVDDIERVWAVKPGSKVLIAVAQYLAAAALLSARAPGVDRVLYPIRFARRRKQAGSGGG